jgi:hypothetical protein
MFYDPIAIQVFHARPHKAPFDVNKDHFLSSCVILVVALKTPLKILYHGICLFYEDIESGAIAKSKKTVCIPYIPRSSAVLPSNSSPAFFKRLGSRRLTSNDALNNSQRLVEITEQDVLYAFPLAV